MEPRAIAAGEPPERIRLRFKIRAKATKDIGDESNSYWLEFGLPYGNGFAAYDSLTTRQISVCASTSTPSGGIVHNWCAAPGVAATLLTLGGPAH